MGKEFFIENSTYMVIIPDGNRFFPFVITASSEKEAFIYILNNSYNQPSIVNILNYLLKYGDKNIEYICNILNHEMINLNICKYKNCDIYKKFIDDNIQNISIIFLHYWINNVISIEEYFEIDL